MLLIITPHKGGLSSQLETSGQPLLGEVFALGLSLYLGKYYFKS